MKENFMAKELSRYDIQLTNDAMKQNIDLVVRRNDNVVVHGTVWDDGSFAPRRVPNALVQVFIPGAKYNEDPLDIILLGHVISDSNGDFLVGPFKKGASVIFKVFEFDQYDGTNKGEYANHIDIYKHSKNKGISEDSKYSDYVYTAEDNPFIDDSRTPQSGENSYIANDDCFCPSGEGSYDPSGECFCQHSCIGNCPTSGEGQFERDKILDKKNKGKYFNSSKIKSKSVADKARKPNDYNTEKANNSPFTVVPPKPGDQPSEDQFGF